MLIFKSSFFLIETEKNNWTKKKVFYNLWKISKPFLGVNKGGSYGKYHITWHEISKDDAKKPKFQSQQPKAHTKLFVMICDIITREIDFIHL